MSARARPDIAALAALLLAAAATAETTVRIAPARADAVNGYQPADLTIRNDTGHVVRAAAMRWVEGGPTVLAAVTVGPDAEQTVRAGLPALSQQQTYEVRLLAEDRVGAAILANLTARIDWPADRVTPEAFRASIDQAGLADALPHWPAPLLRTAFLAAVAYTAAVAALTLAPSPRTRIALLVVTAAIFAAAMALWLERQPIVVENVASNEGVLSVGCRRTTTWSDDRAALRPLYVTPRGLRDDATIVRTDGRTWAPLIPHEVRLFALPRD